MSASDHTGFDMRVEFLTNDRVYFYNGSDRHNITCKRCTTTNCNGNISSDEIQFFVRVLCGRLNDIDIGACALHIWIVMRQSIMVMMTIRLCYLAFLDVRHLLALPSGVVRL